MSVPQQPYGQQPPPYGQQPPGGYPPHGGYPQPPKKKKVWPWVLGGILLVLLLIIGGCVALVGSVANEIDNESKRVVNVSYEAGGTGTASSITYSGSGLDVGQESDVALPWSKDIAMDGLAKFMSLSVMAGVDGGQVSCKITADGKVIAEEQASGQFATATCSGTAD
ncbi:MmpS family transport accessory protein [Nocardia halotolerans]|uniref:MmpS family transport accessory protein n=1 Tax=Nocardia halotolerans TaxID=1755878 RepID=A0ABV8VCJ3_9NOCA